MSKLEQIKILLPAGVTGVYRWHYADGALSGWSTIPSHGLLMMPFAARGWETLRAGDQVSAPARALRPHGLYPRVVV